MRKNDIVLCQALLMLLGANPSEPISPLNRPPHIPSISWEDVTMVRRKGVGSGWLLLALVAGAVVLLYGPTTSVVQAGPTVSELEVEICHVPPGNPANAHTITVGSRAVQAHLNHGDYVGECAPSCEPVGTECTEATAAACCTGLCSILSGQIPGIGCCTPSGDACNLSSPGTCCSLACRSLDGTVENGVCL